MWKTINEKAKIEISDGGEIRRDGMIINQHEWNGYRGVYILGHQYYVHRLVAEFFCKKEKGKDLVDHIDGNKANNKASNLRWVNHSENLKYAFEQGLRPRTSRALMDHSIKIRIPVGQYLDGKLIAQYESISQAAKCVGVASSNLSVAIKKQWSCGGYQWRRV